MGGSGERGGGGELGGIEGRETMVKMYWMPEEAIFKKKEYRKDYLMVQNNISLFYFNIKEKINSWYPGWTQIPSFWERRNKVSHKSYLLCNIILIWIGWWPTIYIGIKKLSSKDFWIPTIITHMDIIMAYIYKFQVYIFSNKTQNPTLFALFSTLYLLSFKNI